MIGFYNASKQFSGKIEAISISVILIHNTYTYKQTYIDCIFQYQIFQKYIFKARNSVCVQGIFSLKMRIDRFFRNKSDDYLYFINLENVFFCTKYPFVFVLAGREY